MTLHKQIEAARELVKEADRMEREKKKLSDAIQSVEWAINNTFVLCTGAAIEGVKHCAPDMKDKLETVISAAKQALSTLPAKPMTEEMLVNILKLEFINKTPSPTKIIRALRDAGVLYVEDK